MFSLNHIILLIICTIIIIIATIISKKFNLSSKNASLIFLIICCISEVIKDLVNIIPSKFGGFILDPNDIPFHLCSIVLFAMLYIVLTKNKENREHIKTAVIVIGLVAPIFALLLPTEGVSFTKVITYQYFIYHTALFWYALYLTITKQVRLGKREYIIDLAYLAIVMMILLYLNSALSIYGTNYCFLREPPIEGLPILNLNHGWYLYFFTLLTIGFISTTIVHLPTMIKEYRNYKKNKIKLNKF